MKIYCNYYTKTAEVDKETPFYQSELLENKITFYVQDNIEDSYYLSVSFLLSNGRKVSLTTRDAFEDGEDTTYTDDDSVVYNIHNFTLTDLVLSSYGALQFTCYINFVDSDGNVTSRGVLVTGLNYVNKTVAYGDNTIIVLSTDDEAETVVQNMLDDIETLNGLLASKADINGSSSVDFNANALTAVSATITTLTTTTATIDTATITTATITDETVTNSTISNATITDETVTNSTITTATITDATIDDLVVNNTIKQGNSTASGTNSTALGNSTASGEYSHSEGSATYANGNYSHTEGRATIAEGVASHAEGQDTTANGDYSHAEGKFTYANGDYSHAEGLESYAIGNCSHAEGVSVVNGDYSHAEGRGTLANGDYQHVFGKYNVADTTSVEIVGYGTSSARANIRTLDTSGNEVLAGDLTINGSTSVADSLDSINTEITNLKSVQNCVDVVATYSDLEAYDTTNLDTDDKIQVIADENYDDDTTIYNWNGSSWDYVGSYGSNSYTKTEVDSLLSDKADSSDVYTQAETDTLLSAKQDTLTAGTGIDITSNVVSINSTYQEKISTLETDLATTQEELAEAKRTIGNLEQACLGNIISDDDDTNTKSGTAYSYTLGSTTLPYGYLLKVGGMSYKTTNLLDSDNISIYSTRYVTVSNIEIKASTTYTFCNSLSNGADGSIQILDSDENVLQTIAQSSSNKQSCTFTTDSTAKYFKVVRWYIYSSSFTLEEAEIMLVEGSTAPTSYSEYFDGIRDSAVTSVNVYDSDSTLVNSISIADEIQALTGYGWGISEDVCNYVDFDNKEFVPMVSRVKISDLTWSYDSTYTRFYATMPSDSEVDGVRKIQILIANYECKYSSEALDSTWDMVCYLSVIYGTSQNYVYIHNTTYTDVDTFLANEGDKYIYYPLATTLTTDISDYITTNNLDDLEASGYITFENTYEQEVPYSIYVLEKIEV